MTESEYQKTKESEMREAKAMIEGIRGSSDTKLAYRDVRPITDVRQMLESSVELYGERTAFYVKDRNDLPYRPITYNQLKADVDALGTALAEKGLTGKRIAVIGENCYQWAVSYLAAVCGVGVAVPLDRELGPQEIEALVAESGAECAMFTKKYHDMFVKIRESGKTALRVLVNLSDAPAADGVLALSACIDEGKALISEGKRAFFDAKIVNTDLCALLFTSGTTGIAKGVMLSHKNLVCGIVLPPTVVSITPDDIFFSILPVHHCYECTCGFLIPLYRGAAIAYCEGLKYIVKNLAEIRPTVLLAVPLILENLYRKIWQNARKTGKEKLLRRIIRLNSVTKKAGINLAPIFFKQILATFGGRMKIVICGGAAIAPAILQGIRDFGIIALQGYGLTECSPICALNPDTAIKNSSAGYLIPGLDGMIDSPDELGIGEICVKGGHVMMGYCGNQAATDDVLIDGWFHTGDLGYIDEDRYVFITGRKKNVIITKNGKNVYPEELEYYLGQDEAVLECMVWGVEGDVTGETLIVATIRPDEELLARELGEGYTAKQAEEFMWVRVDKINEDLALFKKIRKIIIRKEEFEMTTGKKIKRFVESNRTEGAGGVDASGGIA
ncbi:MAG: AMP-binding protein [Clostridiales Family XIII bacterium]|nr:AMP-binding protein [Clostridiales Family XIII bacterium]